MHAVDQIAMTSELGPFTTTKKEVLPFWPKYCQFDEIFATDFTGNCQNDNFLCSQWRKFRQNDFRFSDQTLFIWK